MADEKILVDRDLLFEVIDAWRSPFGYGRFKKALDKLETVLKESESIIEIGDRVIVRSNEDDPFLIGELLRYEDFGKSHQTPLPIVKCEKTGKEFMCMGIMKPYSEALVEKLEELTPKEQWNLLSKNYKRG